MGKNQHRGHVLICDDDESVLDALETILTEKGDYAVTTTKTGQGGLTALQRGGFDVALIDLTLTDLDGLAILRQVRDQGVLTEIILVTGHGSIGTAVEAMRLGAYDYLTKPVDSKDLLRIVGHALERSRLVQTNLDLQKQLNSLTRYGDLIGKSSAMQELFRTIEAVAGSDASVLITGESGTGKELVAHAIHKGSERHKGPFVALNCAALPSNILESELFGHEKGAFTGAIKEKTGYFVQADGGTLFLDEITEMPYELQAKLLRALETQSFRPVGGSRDVSVDVRVLAATNRDPRDAVAEKKLREDVYYRLAVIEIELPALRARTEDIPLLAKDFLQRFAGAANKSISNFSPEAMQALLTYNWPGNVRELRNAIERAVILCRNDQVQLADLPARLRSDTSLSGAAAPGGEAAGVVAVSVGTTVAEMERLLILRTLESCNNNKTHAARMLGVSLKTLHNKLGRYSDENGNGSS